MWYSAPMNDPLSRRWLRAVLVCLVLSASGAVPAWAERISYSGQSVDKVSSEGSDRITIRGNAVVNTGRFEIKAQVLTIYGKNQRYIEADSDILVRDKEKGLNISGARLFFDRNDDVLKLNGNCLLEDFENEMVLRGGILEHRNKENITIIQVGVRVLKKDLNARAEMLVYRRDTDTAELSGMPVVYRKDDEYRARQIVINLDTDEINMVGRVSGEIKGESEN